MSPYNRYPSPVYKQFPANIGREFIRGSKPMLPAEAKVIGSWMENLNLGTAATCVNLGSSTEEFRKKTQPHIDQYVIAPLEKKGVRVIHCDLKADVGVDIVGDVGSPDFRDKLKAFSPKLVICSNMLEHVEDIHSITKACADIVDPNGYLLLTVPRSFPYHPDPIDTYYRPSQEELAGLLPGWTVSKSAEISCGGMLAELRKTGSVYPRLFRQMVRSLLPMYKPSKWYSAAHQLLWLIREYRVSAVLLQKPSNA